MYVELMMRRGRRSRAAPSPRRRRGLMRGFEVCTARDLGGYIRMHLVPFTTTPDYYYSNYDCKVRPGGRVQQVLHAPPMYSLSTHARRDYFSVL